MPNSRFDLAEIARSALNDLPEEKRAAFMAEMLTELRGPRAIELLSKVGAAVSLRMQEMIDEKFPLYDLVAIYGGAAAVHARVCSNRVCADDGRAVGFFDLEGAQKSAALIRQRRIVQRCANGTDQKLNLKSDIAVSTEDRITKVCLGQSDGVLGDPIHEGICTRDVGGRHDL